METYQNISDNDPFYWLLWDDPEMEEFSFDDVLSAYPNHLAAYPSSQEGQKVTAAQQRLPTIDPLDHADSAGELNFFPRLGLYMSTTEDGTAFNHVFTPSYGSTTPGTYQSTTSDLFSLSPRRLSVSLPSPQPLAPRPIAPAPPIEEPPETVHGPADLAVSQFQGNPTIFAGSYSPIKSPDPSINRRPRRRCGGPFVPARERRKQEKPEECPICSKGHPYKADLKKHIAARHKSEAQKLGVSTARFLCIVAGCSQTFSRKDHLLRHHKRKHNGSS